MTIPAGILPGHAAVTALVNGDVNLLCDRCNTNINRRPMHTFGRTGVTVADLLYLVNEHRCAE
jgi:hypothetical protein